MRKSSAFLIFLASSTALLALTGIHASVRERAEEAAVSGRAGLVERLDLTDLCLFTEASYTRNLSLADRHTPFQNGPLSLEHFPSGSLVMPPAIIRKSHEKVD